MLRPPVWSTPKGNKMAPTIEVMVKMFENNDNKNYKFDRNRTKC